MASYRFIHYVASSSKSRLPKAYLQCLIKPRANKMREGVTALTDEAVHICVAAVPKDGESNRAVLAVLSQVLDIPKSDLQITRGSKSREKTIAIGGQAVQNGVACVSHLVERLSKAAEGD